MTFSQQALKARDQALDAAAAALADVPGDHKAVLDHIHIAKQSLGMGNIRASNIVFREIKSALEEADVSAPSLVQQINAAQALK